MTYHSSTNQLNLHLFRTPRDPGVLSSRQQEIADLLLQGCGNAEISEVLKIKLRSVKAHFNRLFLRFGIRDGIKRVKLATLLYRNQLALDANAGKEQSPGNSQQDC